jgi:hypothetical protein
MPLFTGILLLLFAMTSSCSFTINHYQEILASLKGSDFEITHDVDFPPNNVEEIARIEANLGIATKYFIRLRAKHYNALSLENTTLFTKLHKEYGHIIGLHFEASFYTPNSVREGIALEAALLGKTVGAEIKYLSLHCPAKAGTITDAVVPSGLQLYSYDSPYYKDKKYISDSGGRWREGCACNHIGKHPKLLVLTHPNWWYHSNPSENF